MKWCRAIQVGKALRSASLNLPAHRVAHTDTDQAREHAAYDRGYECGLAAGEKHLSEQLLLQRSELLEVQNGVLASLRQTVPQVVRQSERTLIQLALEVAWKLVGELPITAGMVEAAVRSALAQVEDNAKFEIHLHADDLALLQRSNSPLMLPGVGNESTEFHASPEVTRGGCLVHTRFGIVDARRETKLQMIRDTLEI